MNGNLSISTMFSTATAVAGKGQHRQFCSAGQPAPCKGYFLNDVLPCVCGAEGDVITALSQVAVPASLGSAPVPAKLAPTNAATVDDKEWAAPAPGVYGGWCPREAGFAASY